MSVKTIPTEEYIASLLGDKEALCTDELAGMPGFEMDDFHFIMLCTIVASYQDGVSPYRIELGEGSVPVGAYRIPVFTIKNNKK